MHASVSANGRLKRLRAVRRKMSFAAFKRLPRRLGWKHEYYDGRAHLRPASVMVPFRLALARAADRPGGGPRIRRVTPADAATLEAPFLAAFATAPEYATYQARHFRRTAAEYFRAFFGNAVGDWSAVSVLAESDGIPVGAALVKACASGPHLDCLFTHPAYGRRGLATALVARVVRALRRCGERQLLSCAMLANEASLRWHRRFGFLEVPDLLVASYRRLCYEHEVDRHRELNDLPEAELARLVETAAHWRKEVWRLQQMERKRFKAAHLGDE
jgi:ribosomal protein S18 acetylase RimI-like enzyme